MEGGKTHLKGCTTSSSMLLSQELSSSVMHSADYQDMGQASNYWFYSAVPYYPGLSVLPIFPFHVAVDLTSSDDTNNNKSVSEATCNTDGNDSKEKSVLENLEIFGKSRNEFLQVLEGVCKNFENALSSNEWALLTAGGKLCDKIYLDNNKQLYVLVTDDMPDSFRISKPDAVVWNKNANQEEVKSFKADEKIALKCSVTIGNAKFALFLFSPMNISFQVRTNGDKISSLYYHGKVTEEVKMGRGYGNGINYLQKQITITFHDDVVEA